MTRLPERGAAARAPLACALHSSQAPSRSTPRLSPDTGVIEKKFGEKIMNCGPNLTTREGVEGGASCYLLTGRPRLYLACLALAAASSAARELPLSALRSSPDTLRAPPPSAICEQKWA